MHVSVDVPQSSSGVERDTYAQRAALDSQATREWALCTESFARALERHMLKINILHGAPPAAGLAVVRQLASQLPELLIKNLEDGEDNGRP